MRPARATTTMEKVIETLLNVGWLLSIVTLLTLQLAITKRGGWGADDARGEEVRRRMRPYLWCAASVGLLCLLGLLLTRDH